MPRGGARTSAKSPTRSAPPPSSAPMAPPPARAPQAPPPAVAPPSGGGMMSGLMGSMASGMAAGVGMSVANRAVDAVMGPRQTEVVHRHEGQQSAPPAKCQFEHSQLNQCMQSMTDASQCQFYLDTLKACQQTQ
mmetsp:Transcript_28080/g.44566  ORF Transcript_28080/g.44566 Transcript_28080/m.44566 type:complete len:134 (+) Transcript_28080:79-480(+)